jgi:hypothetical protein
MDRIDHPCLDQSGDQFHLAFASKWPECLKHGVKAARLDPGAQ